MGIFSAMNGDTQQWIELGEFYEKKLIAYNTATGLLLEANEPYSLILAELNPALSSNKVISIPELRNKLDIGERQLRYAIDKLVKLKLVLKSSKSNHKGTAIFISLNKDVVFHPARLRLDTGEDIILKWRF